MSPREARDPSERRTLVVGRGISVQGTVQDAERLVVEGTVEASWKLIHRDKREGVCHGGGYCARTDWPGETLAAYDPSGWGIGKSGASLATRRRFQNARIGRLKATGASGATPVASNSTNGVAEF